MTMIMAVDVYYGAAAAAVAGIVFNDWHDNRPRDIFVSHIREAHRYVPGAFYLREMPCILKLLEDHDTMPDLIVIDGYVYLDGAEKAGLGKHLFDALDRKVGIIGVAKNPFRYISADFAVYRGRSKKPLYVTAAGVPVALAKRRVATMRGAFRVPTLLKEADRVSRGFECRGARVSAAVMVS